MNVRIHYFMTGSALLFLALILIKPSLMNQNSGEENCLAHGRTDCISRAQEYKMNNLGESRFLLN